MVDPQGHGLNPHDHWQKTAYSLLVGCILHLCYKSRYDGSPATLAALGQMLSDPKRRINELWIEMLSFPHINGANHPVVGASARDMLDRPPNEAGSVLSTTKSYLDLFRDPTIARNTSRSDFRIQDLMHYVDPVSLYIVTKPNDKAPAQTSGPDRCQHDRPAPGRQTRFRKRTPETLVQTPAPGYD